MDDKKVRMTYAINTSTAIRIANAALEEGGRQDVAISVAISDPAMGLVIFIKSDRATPHSTETSRRKAQTSASTGKATGWMGANLEIALPMASNNFLTNIPGGLPIIHKGILIGGIGIAGGTTEQDKNIAEVALQTIKIEKI